jgi:hypothetical protein
MAAPVSCALRAREGATRRPTAHQRSAEQEAHLPSQAVRRSLPALHHEFREYKHKIRAWVAAAAAGLSPQSSMIASPSFFDPPPATTSDGAARRKPEGAEAISALPRYCPLFLYILERERRPTALRALPVGACGGRWCCVFGRVLGWGGVVAAWTIVRKSSQNGFPVNPNPRCAHHDDISNDASVSPLSCITMPMKTLSLASFSLLAAARQERRRSLSSRARRLCLRACGSRLSSSHFFLLLCSLPA